MNGRRVPYRHGVIFITALGIIVILAGLVLAYAMSMRSESLASGNRLAYAQADAIVAPIITVRIGVQNRLA